MSRIRKHKIGKQTNYKKKKMRKEVLWTIIFGAVLVISIVGMMFGGVNMNSEDTEHYNNYKFKRSNQGWILNVGGEQLLFQYLPGDIEMINLSKESVDFFQNNLMMYISFNPVSKEVDVLELVRFELGTFLAKYKNVYVQNGVTQENDLYFEMPVITCENATVSVSVVLFEEANATSIELENNCLEIKGTRYGILAVKDRILYSLIGVME
ncbi:hypothetical protein HOK51_06525 [Candidatus Woesearchaeota archaeon]|jgi:hypothetical protein|nr:hypothetical protein [Candidatus Woesearchaeota archaeon]MBT6519479.1 hypothetical protein [Candidatus Woesearchaeota archaeon]MBT7368227.1 hypothetical protein [Candidatus Woesearchaeota archaeon]